MRPIALHGHTRAVTRIKYNKDGDLLFSSSKDGCPTVWNAETGDRLGTYDNNGHNGAVWDIDVNWTSNLVATAGADFQVLVWDCRSGEVVAKIPHKVPVRGVAFSHGDLMLLTVSDGVMGQSPAINIYNLPMGGVAQSFKDNRAQYNPSQTYETYEKITCALWGPSNDTIYFSSGGSVVVYNTKRQQEEQFSSPHNADIRRISIDKEYTSVITASSDQTAKLLDIKTLQVMKTYENDKPVTDASISPWKNHIIISGGIDASVVTQTSTRVKFETRFFHKILGHELGTLSGHFSPINALVFNPTGTSFATGGEDGFIRIHHFDQDYHAITE